MTTNELKELLDAFLDRWQPDDIQEMTLEKYVGVNNKDTFCQWVETKTRMLGSIKGMTSIKFGIYERKDPKKIPKHYENDNKYSWLKAYGKAPSEVFENVKADIIKIIGFTQKGKFEEIDGILLPDLFKWKVAFLFSNERLIPIYKREVLFQIANHFGLKTNRKTKISEIHRLMISKKPANRDVYQFMGELYDRFGREKDKDIVPEKNSAPRKKGTRKRKGSFSRNTQPQSRTITRSYYAEQKHNIIQQELYRQLGEKYGKDNVVLEENFIDVKLFQKDFLGFYEVKSASYASECIKEALGQILLYSHNDEDDRIKKIYVVGQYPPTEQDISYIDYLKKNLSLDFNYLNVEI
jgi:hypothetical protein